MINKKKQIFKNVILIMIMLLNPFLIEINRNSLFTIEPSPIGSANFGTFLEYESEMAQVLKLDDGYEFPGGMENKCNIKYLFYENSSGSFMNNTVLIQNSKTEDIIIQKTLTFLYNESSLNLKFINGTLLGKIHLFMKPDILNNSNNQVVISSYFGNLFKGTILRREIIQQMYILDDKIINHTPLYVNFPDYNENSRHYLFYESKSGTLVQFSAEFLRFGIFNLFNINDSRGYQFYLINTDFDIPTATPIDNENEGNNNSNFFSSDNLIGISIGIIIMTAFVITYRNISKSRNKHPNRGKKIS